MSEKILPRGVDEPLQMSIDLKHSLWSEDAATWKDRAPETYKHMKAGVDGGELEESGDALLIRSSPDREIRYGSVHIYYDAKTDSCAANVSFSSSWDDPHDLVDTLGRPLEDFEEMLPRNDEGVGLQVTRTVYAKTLRTLLKRIDAVEAELIKYDEIEWAELEASLKDRAS